ncbi:MAG: SDR family oxidoreductase [Gammaproteobacteria bacterium]|nr:SDR family oxidoreductase [Gammaproteobacteria bacterium]
MTSLTGKKVVVIGGTSGIGLSTALLASEAGAEVKACSRSEDKVREATERYPNIDFSCLDIHDTSGMADFFASIGPIDHLVSAATGANRTMAPFMEQSAEQFSEAFNKFWGYASLVRCGVPHLADNGSITLISGSPARKSNPGMSSISCVGGAVENLVRALALELGPKRVNAVSPGLIDTGMFEHFGEKKAEILGQLTQKLPVPRPGQPQEVAAAVMLCMTNEYITGTIIDVDGGTLLP